MKTSIFTFLLFSLATFAHAQFDKGDKYLGGNVGLGFSTSSFNQNSSSITGSGNNFGISLFPQFFKAANSNTLRGFNVGLGFSTSNSSQNQNPNYLKSVSNGVSASIGYAIRKYRPLSEKLFWYMEYNANIGYSYSWLKTTYLSPSTTTKSDGMGYYVSIAALPALALKVDNRLLVDVNFGGLSTGYNYSSSEGSHNHTYNVSLNLTSRFSLGILWKLEKAGRS